MAIHYGPIRENEYAKIERALEILKGVIAREDKRHMMDADLTISMKMLLEDEIIPQLENELDFDPTPQYLWDDTGGEPPVTLDEMHTAASTGSTTDEQHPQWQQALSGWFPRSNRPPAYCYPYEAARAAIFEEWGNFVRANDCLRLKRYYERRAMEECLDPGPT